MIFLRKFRIRTQLLLTFLVVVLPLLAGELVAVSSFRAGLRDAAEVELTNIVDHLFRLVQSKAEAGPEVACTGYDDKEGVFDCKTRSIRHVIRTFRVGATGYPYVMDSKGNLVIHPAQEGRNIFGSRDSKGFMFIQSIVEMAKKLGPDEVGTIRYPWHNPEDAANVPRMKILKFKYYEPWDWIIAAGSYEEEIFASAKDVEKYIWPLILFSLLLVAVVAYFMSRMFSRPLIAIVEAANRMSAGNFEKRVRGTTGTDEFSTLARTFNYMADQVHEKTEDLEQLVAERTVQLRDSQEKYRSLVEGTVDGIVTADTQGVITFVNRGMKHMLGMEVNEVIGTQIWNFYPEGKEQARTIMRMLRDQGNVANYEMELIGKDRIIPIRTSASRLFDGQGNEIGSFGIFSDITSEKALQEKLRKTQAQVIQSMKLRALGDLVSGVAHEINNPLMAAITMLHVARKKPCVDSCPNARKFELIENCHERITKIVTHLKDFSRQTDLEMVETDVNVPVEDSLLIAGQQLMNTHVSVEKELDLNLPTIKADPNHLEQVFLNIINNARDAMRDRERKVLGIRSHAEELDGAPAVAVSISDTGKGIPESQKEKLFEPFFTTKEVGEGTGLGLSICYGIIVEHGGRIDVESVEGEGTTFHVILPAIAP